MKIKNGTVRKMNLDGLVNTSWVSVNGTGTRGRDVMKYLVVQAELEM